MKELEKELKLAHLISYPMLFSSSLLLVLVPSILAFEISVLFTPLTYNTKDS